MEIKLAVLKGSQEGSDVSIDSVPFEIGRCKSANLIIAHVNVSRNHCQIINYNNLWKINDFSSSGTFVNGVLVGKGKSSALNNGDVIRFGPVESNLSWTFSVFDFSKKQETGTQARVCLNEMNNKVIQMNVGSEEKVTGKLSMKKNVGSELIEREDLICVENAVQEKNKSESEKIQELLKELKQVRNALNTLEKKNTALQGELAAGGNNKCEKTGSNLIENLTEVMETELQCTICSELFVTAVTLTCTHTFCKYCIGQWKRKQKTCPICRKKISNETRSLVVDNYIDKMVGNLSAELKQRREAIIKERIEIEPIKKRRSQK